MIKSVEPVIISKEVAEKIERLREIYVMDSKIVEVHINDDAWGEGFESMDSVSLDKLIRILYFGYEIEKSPEEKVKELYESYHHGAMSGEKYHEGAQDAIEQVLKIIGMKVEGIDG